MAVTAEIFSRISFSQTGSSDFGPPEFRDKIEALYQFASGTGANQADILFVDERAFSASTADNIDVAGALSSAFGATITAVEMVALLIVNKTKAGVANTVTLSLGAGSAPYFGMFGATGDVIKIPPGGMLLMVAPDASGFGTVTATTGDLLTVTPGAAAGSYVVAMLGRTA